MLTNADHVARSLAKIPDVRSKTAVLVERVGTKCRVNVGDSSVVLPFVGLSLPPAGHAVQLELRAGQLVVTGPATPLPGEGVITGTGSPRATVDAWGVSYTLRFRNDYTPELGDLVSIVWSADGEGVIQYKISAASGLVPPSANPGSGSSGAQHPAPFLAMGSGTYRAGSGWWTSDVYASTSDGAYWYEKNGRSALKDTIPDDATITSARIFLPIRVVNVAAPGQMRLHTDATRPGGPPDFTGSASPVAPTSGWHNVPLAWIDYLKANSGGIGFDGGGYWIIKGIDSDRQSGALDISYRA